MPKPDIWFAFRNLKTNLLKVVSCSEDCENADERLAYIMLLKNPCLEAISIGNVNALQALHRSEVDTVE